MGREQTKAYSEKRVAERHAIRMDVNYRHGDTYLYSRSSNISEMGIFLATSTPLGKGTRIELSFSEPGQVEPIRVRGDVAWTTDGGAEGESGMGIQFLPDTPEETRARIKALIRTMAYLE